MTYGERLMEASTEKFQKWRNLANEIAINWNNIKTCVWIFPASFCAVHYRIHGSYILGDKNLREGACEKCE